MEVIAPRDRDRSMLRNPLSQEQYMQQRADAREIITIEEFVALSAKINYQLSSRSLNRTALL